MKWVKTDYRGNPQVWYSGDVIERIYKIAKECNYLDDREAISDILDIIESEGVSMSKNCITCKNAYIKDGVYLVCDIDGVQNDIVENCKNYERKTASENTKS